MLTNSFKSSEFGETKESSNCSPEQSLCEQGNEADFLSLKRCLLRVHDYSHNLRQLCLDHHRRRRHRATQPHRVVHPTASALACATVA